MTSTVLVALDGSDKDSRALPVAAAIAELAGANVRVVRVIDTPIGSVAATADPFGISVAARTVRATAESGLRDAARSVDELIDRPTTWEIIVDTDVAAALLRDIEAHDTAFVVMATRAAAATGRAIHGSVADQLTRESPRPVVLVPPRAGHLGGKRLQLRRVLVPLDGSPAALRVIEYLLALPLSDKLEYVLIQAVSPERTGGYAMPPGIPVTSDGGDDTQVHISAERAEEGLNDVAERLRGRGGVVEVRVVESRDAGAVILDAVRNDLVDLIAMSTRGASGIKRLVLGSVAEAVVRWSEIPVMLVTPH